MYNPQVIWRENVIMQIIVFGAGVNTITVCGYCFTNTSNCFIVDSSIRNAVCRVMLYCYDTLIMKHVLYLFPTVQFIYCRNLNIFYFTGILSEWMQNITVQLLLCFFLFLISLLHRQEVIIIFRGVSNTKCGYILQVRIRT